ncbi:MAG: hypothetical protein HOV81_07465 [Kofleriaceae bacterium]|nr:hypothetical protein [Kofleriaceae bacterium]
MRVLAGVGLGILFVLGAAIGLVIGFFVFWVSLYRRARAVHAEGIVCRAEITARDPVIGPVLAGPALVRLSGAFEGQRTSGTDVLGFDIRMQKTFDRDGRVGDQDLLLGSFESFTTAARDRAKTDVGDYLANEYSSVTPWWVSRTGPAIFRIKAPVVGSRDRGVDRIARLDSDLAADRARLVLSVHGGGSSIEVAELRLVERFADDDRTLRASMFRQGRALRPLGIRNGIRASVYPMSQLARRLRGG